MKAGKEIASPLGWFYFYKNFPFSTMKTNALAVANYLIDLYWQEQKEVRLLKLMKMIYLCHGFSLAMEDRSALNPHYDSVEAWRYGPVIPSVYHSFKEFGRKPIKKKTVFLDVEKNEPQEAVLSDLQIQRVCQYVYSNFGSYEDSFLVKLLHVEGSPWSMCYKEGENVKIPDSLTKKYYLRYLHYAKTL